jgi:hypothetical protein
MPHSVSGWLSTLVDRVEKPRPGVAVGGAVVGRESQGGDGPDAEQAVDRPGTADDLSDADRASVLRIGSQSISDLRRSTASGLCCQPRAADGRQIGTKVPRSVAKVPQ